jgi:hypothetical protein
MLKKWIVNVLVGVDQLANAFAGGDPDETISSRCGKRQKSNKVCRWLCGLLNKIDRRHCAKSIEPDVGRRAL